MLHDKHTLSDYNVVDRSTLSLHVLKDKKGMFSLLTELIPKSSDMFSAKLGHQMEHLEHKVQDQMHQFQAQLSQHKVKTQETTLQLETVATDLKLELHIEKEQTKRLQSELNAEKTKIYMLQQNFELMQQNYQLVQQRCHYLENTVIVNLLERLKGLEDTVERLWAIS